MIHALGLPAGPGIVVLGEAMLDAVFEADVIGYAQPVVNCRP